MVSVVCITDVDDRTHNTGDGPCMWVGGEKIVSFVQTGIFPDKLLFLLGAFNAFIYAFLLADSFVHLFMCYSSEYVCKYGFPGTSCCPLLKCLTILCATQPTVILRNHCTHSPVYSLFGEVTKEFLTLSAVEISVYHRYVFVPYISPLYSIASVCVHVTHREDASQMELFEWTSVRF